MSWNGSSSEAAGNYSQADTTSVFTVYSVVSAAGVLLNGLVLLVIVGSKRLRSNVPNVFIANLALSDLLFSSGMPLIVWSTAAPAWTLGPALCKLANGLDALNMYAGILILVLMSMDRYLAIVHCMRSVHFRVRTMLGCQLAIAGTWAFSLLMTAPAWLTAEVVTIKGKVMCHLQMPSMAYELGWLGLCFTVGYLFPLIAISTFYLLIYLDLRRTQENSAVSATHRVDKTTTKLVKMVLIMIIAFVICWTPLYLCNFFAHAIPDRHLKQRVFEASVGLNYLHPILNPAIYICNSETFRKQLHSLCTQRGPRLPLDTTCQGTLTESVSQPPEGGSKKVVATPPMAELHPLAEEAC